LYDPAMETSSAMTAISAWKPAVPGVREVLEGDFGEHAYPPHTHDTWTLFLVDAGAIRYDLGRTERAADPAMVSILPPFVVHDGRPATPRGYETRVIYLEPEVIGEARIGPAVDAPVASHGKVRLLAHFTDFHGWDLHALWDDIKFSTTHCNKIDHVALVGDKRWEEWMAKVCKPFTMASIGGAIATRAIMADLRVGADGITGGPAPFAKADRSRFLQALDEALIRLGRS